jgi:hypothetical protein
VTVLGNNAFTGCFNLASLVIGDSVTTIGSGAFYECINLTNITIGAGVTNLGSDGFNDSASLTAIDVSPLNPDFSTVRGMLFDKNQTTLLYCPEGIAGSCTIPSSVTNLADFAFLDDFRLTAVYFEGNAPSLGSLVFDDPLTVFYRPGTTGWASPFGGLPAVEWNPQARPVGTGTSPFGLAITGNSNLVVVVEACTNLTQPLWQPVQTNTLTNATAYYSDPQWSNYPARYFRLRSP